MKVKKIERSDFLLSMVFIVSAFITYSSMYAFRKPFTAGIYDHMHLWGIDYKILLITVQVIGYMLSKFIGIKVISEMSPGRRIRAILILIGIAWGSLFLFGLTPYPFNFIWLFFNGLPLGMIWGIVFSFLEGRNNTELLGAGMSASFIVASGMVKAVGKYLVDYWHISEFWMPFVTGMVFIPALLAGVWMLSKLPPPTASDIKNRTVRVPMDGRQRIAFFKQFAVGIVLVVIIYMALTIFRDLRDNFAVEIWSLIGYENPSHILFVAEIPIAILVFLIVALMIFIRNNRVVFYTNIFIIVLGGILMLATTYLYQIELISPTVWMISVGFAMYLAYISYHTMLFERWIAMFRYKSNIGFLMYIADSFGYLASVGVLFYKNFTRAKVNWLSYITDISYIFGILTIILGLLATLYFIRKERSWFNYPSVKSGLNLSLAPETVAVQGNSDRK